MPELEPIESRLLREQVSDDLNDLVTWGMPGAAPFFSKKAIHHRKWETYALASYGTRMEQEQNRFAEAAMTLKLFAAAAVVIPANRDLSTPPIYCRFAATAPAIAALRQMMAELSCFFRPLEDLTSPTLADGYAGLLQPTGRLIIAGPPPFLAKFQNRLFELERKRMAAEAAEKSSDRSLFGDGPSSGPFG